MILSKAVKSHWKIAFFSLKRALRVTLQDLKQVIKASRYRNKIEYDLNNQRFLYRQLEKQMDELWEVQEDK